MRDLINCLWFDGRGAEAALYYTGIFPNSAISSHLDINTEGKPSSEPMTVEFNLNGRAFVALNGGPQFTFNEAVSFQIMCDDQAEVDYYWEKLTDGGEESQCGWLKDRFGVSWQVVPVRMTQLLGDPDPEVVRRVVEAFMPMKKLDVGVLEAAARG